MLRNVRIMSGSRVVDSMNTDTAGLAIVLAWLDRVGWQHSRVELRPPDDQCETLTGDTVTQSLEVNA